MDYCILEERKLLRACLELGLIGEIEHVGSTALAGNVRPKPTIDHPWLQWNRSVGSRADTVWL